MTSPESFVPRPGQLINGLDLWDSESVVSRPGAALIVVRLDANERLLLPFTPSLVRVAVHFLNGDSFRGYTQCSAKDCLLCRLGYKVDQRDLLPVYDPIERTVAVLPIGPDMRPAALRPQLAPVLRRLGQDGARLPLIAIRKPDHITFVVDTLELPDDADDGAALIKAFCNQLEAGQIDLTSAFPRQSNETLAALPEVKTRMQIRGMKL